MTNFDRVSAWLQVYGKQPSKETFSLQVGCMIEEFIEFLETVEFDDCKFRQIDMETAAALLVHVGNVLKKENALLTIKDRTACLDALCDIDVTMNGCSYFAGFDKNGADNEVMTSNESKFENGRPVIMPGGKIGKSSTYIPPQLEKFI